MKQFNHVCPGNVSLSNLFVCSYHILNFFFAHGPWAMFARVPIAKPCEISSAILWRRRLKLRGAGMVLNERLHVSGQLTTLTDVSCRKLISFLVQNALSSKHLHRAKRQTDRGVE